MKHTIFLPVIIAALFFNYSNNNTSRATDTIPPVTTDTFIYHFGDRSVAPAYHRSYTITVTPRMAKMTIESYSDILKRDSVVLTADKYNRFKKSLEALHITTAAEPAPNGCTGGISKSLRLYAGSKKEIKGSVYYCGGKAQGSLSGNVDAASNLFTALFADMNKKIEATRGQ